VFEELLLHLANGEMITTCDDNVINIKQLDRCHQQYAMEEYVQSASKYPTTQVHPLSSHETLSWSSFDLLNNACSLLENGGVDILHSLRTKYVDGNNKVVNFPI